MSEKSRTKKKFRFTFISSQGTPASIPSPTIAPTIDPTQNFIPINSPPFRNRALPNTQLSTIQPTHLSFGHVPPSTTTPIGIPTPITTPKTSQPSQEVSQLIEDVQRQTKTKIFPRGKEFYPNHTHVIHALSNIMRSSSVHCGGSIPHSEHRRRLEKYKKRLSEIQASTQDEGSTSQGMPLPQLSMETHMTIWKEAVGLTKKGKNFGFGIEDSCASTTGPPATTKVSIELFEKEKQSKKKLKKRLHRVEKKLFETTKLVKTLMQQMNFTIPISTNVGVGNGGIGSNSGSNDEDKDGVEDEDEDEDDDDNNDDQQESEDADKNDK
ncbi:hypothetical protein Cgig2_027001 [Carnegiea gigantea]|uniref:Uncharacterized protein n=1 Tax=Carnegiea gigantea TaxID=171969 RepID=A0A9Q1Q7Q4_9CARY|nr:hypothetical protein Cgig2_027001 [Carnegiea gigantea]